MDRSRHRVTNFLSEERTHGAITKKMFKRLGYINDQLYEVALVKLESQHKEPIIVGFFILQYAKFRILDRYYNLGTSFAMLQSLRSWRWIQTRYM